MVRPSFQGSETTYGEDDLIGAAEGVFGKGAEGLAGMIEDILRKQGEPNGYIVGREGGAHLLLVYGMDLASSTTRLKGTILSIGLVLLLALTLVPMLAIHSC